MITASTPTVYKPVRGKLEVHIPWLGYPSKYWLKDNGIRGEWVAGGHWRISRGKYWEIVSALAVRFGRVVVTVDGHKRRVCDIRCRNAQGGDCVCSCAGAHHGMVFKGLKWVQIGETTLIGYDYTRAVFEVAV